MNKVEIKLNEDLMLKDGNAIITGKKGETIQVTESIAKWETDAGRATYAKKNEEDQKK